MVNTSSLYPIFRHLELLMKIHKPCFVIRVIPFIDLSKMPLDDKSFILMGIVKIYIETLDSCFYLDFMACQEDYSDSYSYEIAKEKVIKQTEKCLPLEIKACNWDTFWDTVDFDNEDWKRKEE